MKPDSSFIGGSNRLWREREIERETLLRGADFDRLVQAIAFFGHLARLDGLQEDSRAK